MSILLASLLLSATNPIQSERPAQNGRPASLVTDSAARSEDVASPQAIVRAVYDVISGEKGKPRDWSRFQSLFHPSAIMASTRFKGGTTNAETRVRAVPEYVARNAQYFQDNGFFEKELVSRVNRVGNIAHVFSSYASRHELADRAPFERGINSFELTFDGRRWWILSISWADETHGQPLPVEYTGNDRSKR